MAKLLLNSGGPAQELPLRSGLVLVVRLSHAAAPPAQEEAPPAAVAVEMPPTLPTPTPARPGGLCKYHPRTPARWTCTGCHQLYCDLCVASRPGVANDKRFCRSCG